MIDWQKLQQALTENVVCFVYQKKDGTTRPAVGTRNHEIISLFFENKTDGKNSRKPNDSVLTYFDFTKMQFRCCKKENVLAITNWKTPLNVAFNAAKVIAEGAEETDAVDMLDNVLGKIAGGMISLNDFGGLDLPFGGVESAIKGTENTMSVNEKIAAMNERLDKIIAECYELKKDLSQLV